MPRRLITVFLALMIAAVVVGGVTADTANTYTGCLNRGTLYNVKVGTEPLAACKARDLEVSWNEAGPQGAPGVQGEPGLQGEPGPTGPAGPAGGASLASLDNTPCDLPLAAPNDEPVAATIAYSIGLDGVISLKCFTPAMWCAANDGGFPNTTGQNECDGTTRTITITCVPAPAYWFDINGNIADGCERSYGDAAADLLLRNNRSLELPVSCDGPASFGCHGGVPQDQAPVIEVIANPTTIQARYITGAMRFDLWSELHLQTTAPIPVTLPIFGDCFVSIDTSLGVNPTVSVALQLNLPFDPNGSGYLAAYGDIQLANFSTEDIDISGALGCQLGASLDQVAVTIFRDVLVDTLFKPVCVVPAPDLIDYCDR